MLELYPDQKQSIDALRNSMRRHKYILLQGATGSGKTAMATYMIANAKQKNNKTLFLVPRKELLKQTSESFRENNIPHSFMASGYEFNPYASVYIGMVGTLINRLDKLPKINLLIVDETHYGSGTLDRIIAHFKKQGAYIVGLSATPWKLSGQGLGCWYDNMVCGPSIGDLIENKRLSEYRLFAPNTPDLSGIKISAGDYAKGQLSSFMEQERVLIGNAVNHYREHAMGRLNIAYCVSIKHSQIVCESFKSAGIPAAHIDGKTPDDERRRIIRAFARRELLVLCNCELLTFGFDLSMASGMDITVECMSDLRPTKSLALQMQKWGRVLRYKDYPALIFDHAGNVREFGLPCEDREWSLADRAQKKRGGSEPNIPVRQCEECFFVHRPAPNCPSCGYEYEINGREIDEVDGILGEVDPATFRKQKRSEQGMAKTIDDLIALGYQRGYKNPEFWAAKVYTGRGRK